MGSRVIEVVEHSEGKDALKLEGFAEFRGETHRDENLRWPLGERTQDFRAKRPLQLLLEVGKLQS